MPQYRVTDSVSGKSFLLTGDSPPTQGELEQLFSQQVAQPQPPVLIKNQSGQDGQGGVAYPGLVGATLSQGQPEGMVDKLVRESGVGKLFTTTKPVFQNLPPSDTIPHGIERGVMGLVNSMATPGGLASIAAGGGLAQLGRIPALLTGGAGLAATAPSVGQAAGILSPGSGATGPQRAEAAVLPAAIALPFAHAGIKALLTPKPQLQGPVVPQIGTPEYLKFASAVSQRKLAETPPQESPRSSPPIVQKPSPTAQQKSTNPDVANVVASKNPTTGMDFQTQMRQQTAKMSIPELQQAYAVSKQLATQHGVAGNINAAMEEATRGQFYREQLERLDAQHSLKAAASALRYAKQHNTLTPQEIEAFGKQGNDIFSLTDKQTGKAVGLAKQLYETIKQRNADAINNEKGQVQQKGQEQTPPQSNVEEEKPNQQSGGTGRGGGLDEQDAGVLGVRPSKPLNKSWGERGAIFPRPTKPSGQGRTLSQIRQSQKGALSDWFDATGKPAFHSLLNSLKGTALPRTTAVNPDVSARLYNYAQANAVSDVLSKIDPVMVLGTKDPAFDKKLGATLVEYNLRNEGQTSVGKKWSPFKTDADYQAALKDPEIQAAIDRHSDLVVKDAEQRHSELGGKLIKLDDPRMFVNLKYVPKEEGEGGLRSGLKASLQRKTKFGQQRTGTADEYETSYKALAGRMIKANYAEYQRKLLNDEYVKQGLGQWVKPGDPIPANSVEVPTRIQRAVLLKEGESPTIVNQDKSLYIRKDLAPEYFQALQLHPGMMGHALRTTADVLTKTQVSLGVDALQHSLNILSSVDGVVRPSIKGNLPIAREADTVSRITQNVYKVLSKDPATQAMLRDMAKNYGIAREDVTYKGLLGHKSIGGATIRTIDQAGRVTLFQVAKELADAGLIKNDPVEIRNFVNKHLGQYNTRLISAFNQFAKASFSPFLVAGKTFNRLAASRFLMSPQVKAANPQAWAALRARQALYTATALVIIPAVVNYAIHKDAFPEDAKLGEIKLPDGKFIDVGRYTLLTRGERITGMQPIFQEQIEPRLRGEQPAALSQSLAESGRDVVRGLAAPYAGPLPNMAATLATGKTALGYQAAQPGEQWPYFKAAARQANPILGAGLTDQPGQASGKRLEGMLGVRENNPRAVVNNLRRQYLYKIGKINQDDDTPSNYVPLRDALIKGDVATAKTEYQKLLTTETQQHQGDPDPEGEAKRTLQEYFKRFEGSHGQTTRGQEDEFKKTLTYHQQQLYNQALDQQKAASELFFKEIQPDVSNHPRGIRPPSIKRFRHFSGF